MGDCELGRESESGGVSESESVICQLCGKQHKTARLYGVTYIPCPKMPENMIMSNSSLEIAR